MTIKDADKALNYEMLIRNTFGCERGPRHGALLSYMEAAMAAERGEGKKELFEKHFLLVKDYIGKALLKLMRTKPYLREEVFFKKMNSELPYMKTTTELMEMVDLALEKVLELKKLKYKNS